MNKVAKYWMNFNLLMFLFILLMLPFVPYAKFSGGRGAKDDVLSTSTVKPFKPSADKVLESSPSVSTGSAKPARLYYP
ncbi:hypothetical protein A2716_02650 [candidate division WWE3 bacterium RIFCSPHIGHO2_01_FULL_40_23]|uniref:Uncharacterized protein n=1 Tax=candidate division WWE3 bacterium RIFCSPLOWO2_01_FULL_41_18 TaxID=1802625 RepID=A0A1F4VFJ1_UNCKA|nr:MAG: hypothetical protein A2716_02650 [candidate division WWE3 bacterium RIFCSPHIGHO2_01_FULL_40_23]OGC55885.1 MAG: hypothetical protein A3A78_02500 [candidate division WWE3 bacterium RIFCSPLOWO2_01_FULL_41_18]